jgi:carbon storage regulator
VLVLTRKSGEGIIIGDNIRIVALNTEPSGDIRLGIDAPRSVEIYRDEIYPGDLGRFTGSERQ